MTNGYIVLTKGEPNLYKHAVEAITLGKPIYYADGNKVAFVNSIELDSTNVIIKTSDKQITVTSDGTETEKYNGLKALLFDSSDFNLDGATAANDPYIAILTSLDVKKISEFPIGRYAVMQGTVKDGDDIVKILYIERQADSTLSMYLANDNDIVFTIGADNEATVINI